MKIINFNLCPSFKYYIKDRSYHEDVRQQKNWIMGEEATIRSIINDAICLHDIDNGESSDNAEREYLKGVLG